MNDNPFEAPLGTNKAVFKVLLLKRYFEMGYGLTNYVKYLLALFGVASQDVKNTMLLAGVYAVMCLVIGYYWYKWGLFELDTEISNRFNGFVREMRAKIKSGE